MEEVRCVRNARICLCVLCGLPAAGKSKLAQVLHEHLEKRGFGVFVLSYDELIPDEPFEFNTGDGDQNRGSSWKMRRQRVLRTLARFLHRGCADDADAATWTRLTQELHQLRARGHQSALVILLDDNFYYQSMRYEVYQLARRYSMGFCQLYVQRPVTSCLRRNRTRSCPLPDEVIVAMEKRLEPPNPLKNSWEHSSLTMTSEDGFSPQGIELSIDLIAASLDNPLSPIQDDTEQKEADRQRCTSSVMHQADQACRRLVSQAMQSAREKKLGPESMRSLAAELNQLKERFLDDLRKEMLQWCPVSTGENMDVGRVVSRAVAVFDQKKNECVAKHSAEHKSNPP